MQDAQNKRSVGETGEEAVCGFLMRHGYRLICRNYTIKGGEIDIIAEKDGVTAFVEVKSRKEGSLTEGEDAVTPGKRRRIIKTAETFLFRHGSDRQCRFDVAVVRLRDGKPVKIKYYVAAFDASM